VYHPSDELLFSSILDKDTTIFCARGKSLIKVQMDVAEHFGSYLHVHDLGGQTWMSLSLPENELREELEKEIPEYDEVYTFPICSNDNREILAEMVYELCKKYNKKLFFYTTEGAVETNKELKESFLERYSDLSIDFNQKFVVTEFSWENLIEADTSLEFVYSLKWKDIYKPFFKNTPAQEEVFNYFYQYLSVSQAKQLYFIEIWKNNVLVEVYSMDKTGGSIFAFFPVFSPLFEQNDAYKYYLPLKLFSSEEIYMVNTLGYENSKSKKRILKNNADIRVAENATVELSDIFRLFDDKKTQREDVLAYAGLLFLFYKLSKEGKLPGLTVIAYYLGEERIGAEYMYRTSENSYYGLWAPFDKEDPLIAKRSLGIYSCIKAIEYCKRRGITYYNLANGDFGGYKSRFTEPIIKYGDIC
jgi:hypothetical protein